MRALLVDKDRHELARLRAALSVDGYEVLTSSTGQGALAVVVEQSPEVILLECDLPDLDGTEICRRVRRLRHYTPIVMFSYGADVDQRVKGLEAGADVYLTKPLVLAELLARVHALVRHFESAGERAALPDLRSRADATVTGSHLEEGLAI